MNKTTEVEVIKPMKLVPSEPPATLEVADMLSAVIAKGVSADNVAALEQLVKLYEHMEERNSEKAFAAAFVALQGEMPTVRALKAVPNRDGGVRYMFAPYEDIMAQVAPLLQKHGFTVTFSTKYGEGRLTKICTLQHMGGHSKSNEFAVRIGSGPPGATETQGDGAAGTYAKRFALTDALNIVIEKDSDARAEGGPITADQAKDLQDRLRNVDGDEKAFLNFAKSESFETIASVKLEMLQDFITRKERIKIQKMGGK